MLKAAGGIIALPFVIIFCLVIAFGGAGSAVNMAVHGEDNPDPNAPITYVDVDSIIGGIDYSYLSEHRRLLLQLAFDQLGKPYFWGHAGPNSFDCSGLVLWLYRQIQNRQGPRYHRTNEQCQEGRVIPMEAALPGDAVYFGSTPPGHVGIWLGSDKFIHAPHSGDVVKVSVLSSHAANTPVHSFVRFMDPEKDVVTSSGDPVERSRAYMERKGFDPGMVAAAELNVERANHWNMDFRMALVAGLVESSGGKVCFLPYNPFGLGSYSFPSFNEAFDKYYETIAGYNLGRDAVAIFHHYNEPGGWIYVRNCLAEFNSI